MGQDEQTDRQEPDQQKKSVEQIKEEVKAARRRSQFSQNTLFDMPGQARSEAAVLAAAQAGHEPPEALESLPQAQPGQERPVPGVSHDDFGAVVRVTYPDYSGYEFTYSGGEVSDMVLKNRDGKVTATWHKSGDGYIERRIDTDAANASRTWRGEIEVDQSSGDVTFRPKFSHLTITESASAGTAVSTHTKRGWAVTRARDGKVIRVDYSPDSFRSFEYDSHGLNKMAEGEDFTYTRQIDGTWLKLDKRTNTSEFCRESFLVNERGDLIAQGAGYQVCHRPDGTRIGYEMHEGGRLLVKVVSHPEVGDYHFAYSPEAQLSTVVWPDGTTDTRLGPDRWCRQKPEFLDLDQQVDADGNLLAVSKNGMVEVVRPDGSARIEFPNGTQEEHARGGMLIWKLTPARRIIRLNEAAGQYQYEVHDGDTVTDIARDFLRAADGSAKYEPSREEVAEEIHRLLEMNGLTESSTLAGGMSINVFAQASTPDDSESD